MIDDIFSCINSLALLLIPSKKFPRSKGSKRVFVNTHTELVVDAIKYSACFVRRSDDANAALVSSTVLDSCTPTA